MNSVELRIWKMHEQQAEAALSKEIENQQKRLLLRQQLIDSLDKLLGEMLGDLIDGEIVERESGYVGWRLPITYRGIPGYFSIDIRGALYCKFADSYEEYIASMNQDQFLTLLDNRYQYYVDRHKSL